MRIESDDSYLGRGKATTRREVLRRWPLARRRGRVRLEAGRPASRSSTRDRSRSERRSNLHDRPHGRLFGLGRLGLCREGQRSSGRQAPLKTSFSQQLGFRPRDRRRRSQKKTFRSQRRSLEIECQTPASTSEVTPSSSYLLPALLLGPKIWLDLSDLHLRQHFPYRPCLRSLPPRTPRELDLRRLDGDA